MFFSEKKNQVYDTIFKGANMGYPAKKDQKYTYSDYLKTPDDKRFQLIEGELIMTPAPNTKHQSVSMNLVLILGRFVTENKTGKLFDAPTDVVLDDFNVVQPDILLVLNERKEIITEANIKGAPDLIIEIISPSNAYEDLVRKKKLYEKFGVKEYWTVDPQSQTAETYILKEGKFTTGQRLDKKDTLTSPLLPRLKVSLAVIFAEE